MAQKMEKLDRNEECFLLVAENTENGDLCGSLLGVEPDEAAMKEKVERWEKRLEGRSNEHSVILR